MLVLKVYSASYMNDKNFHDVSYLFWRLTSTMLYHRTVYVFIITFIWNLRLISILEFKPNSTIGAYRSLLYTDRKYKVTLTSHRNWEYLYTGTQSNVIFTTELAIILPSFTMELGVTLP